MERTEGNAPVVTAAGDVEGSGRDVASGAEVAFFELDGNGSRPSSASGGASDSYSDYSDSDDDDDGFEEEDLSEEVIQARLHDDEYRDIMHFFKDYPTLARTQATLRASGVHKIAQLKRLTMKQLLQFGVPIPDAEVLAEALGLVRAVSATPEPVPSADVPSTVADALPSPSPTLPLTRFTDLCPAFVQYKEANPAPSPSSQPGWDKMSTSVSASPSLDEVDADGTLPLWCRDVMRGRGLPITPPLSVTMHW